VIATLMKNNTEQMQAVKMIRLCFKNYSIHLLRIRQSTSLMKRQRLAEC
jgi:hypothetical protein